MNSQSLFCSQFLKRSPISEKQLHHRWCSKRKNPLVISKTKWSELCDSLVSFYLSRCSGFLQSEAGLGGKMRNCNTSPVFLMGFLRLKVGGWVYGCSTTNEKSIRLSIYFRSLLLFRNCCNIFRGMSIEQMGMGSGRPALGRGRERNYTIAILYKITREGMLNRAANLLAFFPILPLLKIHETSLRTLAERIEGQVLQSTFLHF